MTKFSILYPMIAMAWLTVSVLMLIPYRRFKAIKNKELTANDFSLGESSNVSVYVALANRNYMNLLEAPIIFYITCLLMYLIDSVTLITVVLSWCYVALRSMHSFVHVTNNNVRYRLMLFALSNFVLITLLALLTASIL